MTIVECICLIRFRLDILARILIDEMIHWEVETSSCMLSWVVPLLVMLNLITCLRQGQNNFSMTTLILLPTANILNEVQHLFVALFALRMYSSHVFSVRVLYSNITSIDFSLIGCITNLIYG